MKKELQSAMPRISEESHQVTVFEWAKYMEGQYPELKRMHHIPNGGYRSKAEAGRFKAMGVKPGVPDICLPAPRRGFHGLYIEMKAEGGRVSEKQAEWLTDLSAEGYACCVCYNADEAIKRIMWYIRKEQGRDERKTEKH